MWKYGSENYRLDVFVNEKKIETNNVDYGGIIDIPDVEKGIKKIVFSNVVFEGKKTLFLGVLYWFLAFVSGCSERHPFGYPFNIELKFKTENNKQIFIETDSIWAKKPFIIKGDCEELEITYRGCIYLNNRREVPHFW